MINLLPPEIKDGYRYGRRNVSLRLWVVAFVIALLGLGVIATYGLLTLQQANKHYSDQIATANTQLKNDKLDQTKQQVQDISSSLKLAVQVLSQEVLFSKLITQIGAVMPSGSVLTGLNINKVGGGLDLTAAATDYQAATQVQVNLSAPSNQIFSKVDLENISCPTVAAAYPCSVQLRALFDSNNPFLFINEGGKK